MCTTFYIPSFHAIGDGSLMDAINYIKEQGFKQGFIVSDKVLNKIGVVKTLLIYWMNNTLSVSYLIKHSRIQQSAMLTMD